MHKVSLLYSTMLTLLIQSSHNLHTYILYAAGYFFIIIKWLFPYLVKDLRKINEWMCGEGPLLTSMLTVFHVFPAWKFILWFNSYIWSDNYIEVTWRNVFVYFWAVLLIRVHFHAYAMNMCHARMLSERYVCKVQNTWVSNLCSWHAVEYNFHRSYRW
jgi:hypothetical protein